MLSRSYKYRLLPTAQQAATLSAWQAACWEIQRLCIMQRRIAWEKARTLYSGQLSGQQPSGFSQAREVTELRAEYPYMSDVPAFTMGEVVRRVDTAYQRMIRARKAGKRSNVRWDKRADHVGLTFRGAKNGTRAVRTSVKFVWWQIATAKKLGPIKARTHRHIPDDATIRQAHITRAADGWYITFSCDVPAPAPLASADCVVGVDLNVKHEGDTQEIAAADDGRIYRTPATLKSNAARLATLQRLADPKRKVRGSAKTADPKSKRTAKRRARIARLHQRIARQREHAQHYAARRLVNTADVVVFEQLNHTAMRRKGRGRRKRGLNRSLSTAAPGNLIKLVRVKAEAAGRQVATVDARNTSRACSDCGALSGPQGAKGLKVRKWVCSTCDVVHHRDVNAARNIRARFEGTQPACGGGLPGEGADLRVERPSMNLEARPSAKSELRTCLRQLTLWE